MLGLSRIFRRVSGRMRMKGSLAALQDERGHGDAVDHMRGGGAVIVVVGAGESAIECGDPVVKFAQAADAAEARSVERAGKQAGLGAQPALQLPQEILFVQAVAAQMQSVGRGGEVDRRTDCRHGAKLTRDRRFPTRPPISAPGCRPWKIPPARSGRCGPARSDFAPRRRRPASGRNGRAWAPGLPCRRSCAGSCGRRSCRGPGPWRQSPACSWNRSSLRGRGR